MHSLRYVKLYSLYLVKGKYEYFFCLHNSSLSTQGIQCKGLQMSVSNPGVPLYYVHLYKLVFEKLLHIKIKLSSISNVFLFFYSLDIHCLQLLLAAFDKTRWLLLFLSSTVSQLFTCIILPARMYWAYYYWVVMYVSMFLLCLYFTGFCSYV